MSLQHHDNITGSLNGTENDSGTVSIFFAIFIPILSFVTIFGNTAIIVAFWKVPSLLEKPSELLILNLAFVDLATGLVTLPIWSPAYITPESWPFGEIGCRVLAAFNNITVHASLFAITTISVDRLLLVMMEYPRYLKLESKPRIHATITACWIFAFLTIVPQQALWDIAKEIDLSARNIDFDVLCLFPPRRLKVYSSTVFLTLYFVPVMLLCALSVAFLWFLRRRLRRNRQVEGQRLQDRFRSQQQQPGSPRSHQSRYTKPAASLIAVVSAMAICMLPYCFYVMFIELVFEESNNPPVLYALLLLQFCNACLDPVFYGMTQRKIRQFYGICSPKDVPAGSTG